MSISHRSLCLLICGSTSGKVYADNGDYSAIFQRFLEASLPSGVALQFTLDPYNVVEKMEYPTDDKVDDYDGIIITGSPAAAYENIEWVNTLVAFVKKIAETKPHIKLIGICFGHQIIARALGGSCVPNGGRWEVGPTPITLTDLGKQIFGVDSLNIQEMHRDHVPALTPSFHLLGSTLISPNQGMIRFLPGTPYPPSPESLSSPSPQPASYSTSHSQLLTSIQIITTQGHPEFTESIVSGLVEQRSSSGVIDAEAAQDAERRRWWRNDGISVVGKVVWGVLGVVGVEG